MCTTSLEYKTIIIAMLTIMNSMDPHIISGTWDGFGSVWLVWLKWVSLGYGLVTVRLRDAIEVVTLRR
jgi:hypothetical protein